MKVPFVLFRSVIVAIRGRWRSRMNRETRTSGSRLGPLMSRPISICREDSSMLPAKRTERRPLFPSARLQRESTVARSCSVFFLVPSEWRTSTVQRVARRDVGSSRSTKTNTWRPPGSSKMLERSAMTTGAWLTLSFVEASRGRMNHRRCPDPSGTALIAGAALHGYVARPLRQMSPTDSEPGMGFVEKLQEIG